DYLEFGEHWTVDYGYVYSIHGIPQDDTGDEYTLNLTDVTLENCYHLCMISMGNFKINFNGECLLRATTIALSCFDRGQIGNRITINGKLTVEECGEIVAGSITVFQPSMNYGSGSYIHPSVVVKCYGELH